MRKEFFDRTIIKLIALLLVLNSLICLLPAYVGASGNNEEKQVSRLINVVYDDSNSMLMDQRLWWCYAKYSLEVFSAMMQDKDNMNIYFMSDKAKAPRISNLSGDRAQQQKNIQKIHDTVTNTAGTPFSSIEKAYSDLKGVTNYDEKWLVVITDGDSFNDNETASDIDALINDCAGYNIKVVYLAIGDALVPTQNESKGIYVYKADGQVSSGETGILSRVTQICQRIFQRPAIKTTSNSKITLQVPVSEVIVFAQGENVSIGELSGTKRTLSTVAMRESDKNKATTNKTYKNNINIDTLNASIATFTAKSGSYIPEGTYDLPISAEEYVIYYKPALDVILQMYDSNGNIVSDKYIPIGSYNIKYWLTYPVDHPKYGEKVDQNLFDVDFSLSCKENGVTRRLNSDKVDLNGGDTTISVLAEYLNFSSSDAALKYVVEDFTINEVDVSVEYLQKEYLLSTLESENDGFLVKVSKNGSPIPKSEWEAYTLKFNIDNPEFRVVKNSNSTFNVYPQYSSEGRSKTNSGKIVFNVTASASNGHRVTDSGTCAADITIYDDLTSVSLGVNIEDQSNNCDNKNFLTQDTQRKVTIDWNGRDLTREQYNALELSVSVDDPMYTASIELDPYVEGQPTTATVYFDIVRNEDGNVPPPKKLHGTKDFTVAATIDREGEISVGESTAELKVKDARTLKELLLDWLPFIIALLIILFLILGYAPIIKRYLPIKSKYRSDGPHTIRWYNKPVAIITLLLPFVRVRSSVNLQLRATHYLQMNVKALGRKRAVCTNRKQIEQQGFRIPQQVSLTSGAIQRNGRTYVNFTR